MRTTLRFTGTPRFLVQWLVPKTRPQDMITSGAEIKNEKEMRIHID